MNKIISRARDWLLLIGYVVLIYATLPLMPGISAYFSSLFGQFFGIIANLLLIGIIAIVFAVLFKNNSAQKSPMFYAGLMAILASYTALLYVTPIPVEKMHLLEYGFLSYLTLRALSGTQPPWKRHLCIIFIIILVSYCDELIQAITPGRFYEIRDVFLNIVSGMLGLFALKLLGIKETLLYKKYF